jgi:hypothetical protein
LLPLIAAAGLNTSFDSQAIFLPVIGSLKKVFVFGDSTGFFPEGLINGPKVQAGSDCCAGK